MDNTDGMPKGWLIMRDSGKEKVQTKFSDLINQWKTEHTNKGFAVFEISDEDVV